MAARTFTSAGVNNLWSNPANWDGGATIPQEDDSVTIPAGQTCEYDYNSAYTTGINGLTITGTLKLTRTAGTYKLFMKAATTINGAGTFDGGTTLDPITATTIHTITGGSGWYFNINSTLTVTVCGVEPSIKYIQLSGNEAALQTELSVDTDVTGVWNDGDEIIIVDNDTVKDLEIRTIAAGGIAAGAITVTAGLTAEKKTGSFVILCNRNVKIIGNAGDFFRSGNVYGKLTLGSGQYVLTSNHRIFRYAGAVVNGGIFYASTYTGGIQGDSSDPLLVTNAIFCNMSYGTYYTGNSFDNCVIAGMGYADFGIGGSFTNCKFIGNSNITTSGFIIDSCTYYGNVTPAVGTATIYNSTFVKAYPSIFVGNFYNCLTYGTEIGYRTNYAPITFSASYDHNQVAGIVKFWTQGGISLTQSVTVPTGYASSMKTTFESALKYGWWKKEITVGAGASVNITMNLRKDASMAYLPRVIVFNKASADPFAGGAGLYTFTMTNSIDTWEDDLYTYTNTTSEDITLVIRCQGMNATGNMYSALLVEQINVDLTGAIAKIDVIDGLVDAIKAKTDQLAFTVANQVDANALTGGGGLTQADVRTAVGLATANLDTQLSAIDTDVLGATVEGSYSVQDILKIMASVLAGKASGGGTTNIKYRDLSDTLDRIDETVDSNGNRTTVTRNTA